jgi:hypothetical protein
MGEIFPSSLSDIDSFAALSKDERSSFLGRIRFIGEITGRIDEFFSDESKNCDVEELRDLVDNLELDLMACLSIEERNRKFSPWIVHSSWTFDVTVLAMRRSIAPEHLNVLQANCPTSDAPSAEVLQWISQMSRTVRELRSVFLKSDSRESVMGSLVALDIALANFLLGITRQRLNIHVSR